MTRHHGAVACLGLFLYAGALATNEQQELDAECVGALVTNEQQELDAEGFSLLQRSAVSRPRGSARELSALYERKAPNGIEAPAAAAAAHPTWDPSAAVAAAHPARPTSGLSVGAVQHIRHVQHPAHRQQSSTSSTSAVAGYVIFGIPLCLLLLGCFLEGCEVLGSYCSDGKRKLSMQPSKSWYSQFEAAARSVPSALALVSYSADTLTKETEVTFAQLHGAIDFYARELFPAMGAAGWSPGQNGTVALAMHRSPEFAALLLSVSKLGAKTLPLPPEYPAQRLESILGISKALVVCMRCGDPYSLANTERTVLRMPRLAEALREPVPAEALPQAAMDDPLLGGVVLSSSGTTGVPKLIQRSERSFAHRIEWTWAKLPFKNGECSVQKSHMATTHSLYELLEPLLAGATVALLPDVGTVGVDAFWALVAECRARRLLLVPSLLATSLGSCASLIPRSLEVVQITGEPPQPDACARLLKLLPGLTLLSIYGCTEASLALYHDIGSELAAAQRDSGGSGVLPLGRPLTAAVRAHVLDEALKPVAVGATGTLHFSGPHLFDGYVGMPERTAAVLVHDAALGVLFNTNDRVELGADGSLRWTGRADDLVKVRGNRVQLSEVEHHLASCAGIISACVLVDEGSGGLAAFVAPAEAKPEAIRGHLGQQLPAYMVPGVIRALPELPLTPSSKLDRNAMKRMLCEVPMKPAPPLQDGASERDSTTDSQSGSASDADTTTDTASAQQTDNACMDADVASEPPTTTQRVVAVLEAISGVPAQDGDRIASLGIDSLRAVKVGVRLHEEFGVKIPDIVVMQNPTVSELVAKVEALLREVGDLGAESSVNLQALHGLRCVMSLWILRGHMPIYYPHSLGWVQPPDTSQYWRVYFFMVVAGIMVSTKCERGCASGPQLFLESIPQLFPVYWAAFATWLLANILQGTLGGQDKADLILSNTVSFFGLQGVLPLELYAPGRFVNSVSDGFEHCAYIGHFMFFMVCYSPVQRVLRCLAPGSRLKASRLFMYCAIWGFGIALLVRCRWLQGSKGVLSLEHFWAPVQLPTFALGALVGQACLKVQLSPLQRRTVAVAVDLVVVAVVIGTLMPRYAQAVETVMYECRLIAAFIVFGVCASPSLVGKLLSLPVLARGGEFSYVLFVIHPMVLLQWRRQHGTPHAGHVRYPPPPLQEALAVSILCIALALLLTWTVHNPCQRAMSRRIAQYLRG